MNRKILLGNTPRRRERRDSPGIWSSPIFGRFLLVLGVFAFVVLFNWAYKNTVSPVYAYIGAVYYPPSLFYLLLAYVIALLPAFWMPIAVTRPSQVLYWFLYVVVFIPSAFVPFYILPTPPLVILWRLVVLLAMMALLGVVYRIPLQSLPRLSIDHGWVFFWLSIAVMSGVFYAIVLWIFGLRFDPVSFEYVYDVREIYAEIVGAKARFATYIVQWQANVLNVLFMCYGLFSRNILLLAAGILGQIYLYTITGFKSLILSIVLSVVLVAALRWQQKRLGLLIVWGLGALLVVAVVGDQFIRQLDFNALFLYRFLTVPGMLTGYYFDFFSTNPQVYLSHSILSPFLTYPYDLPPAYVIGWEYFRNPYISANAHIWADAFANFGMVGIVFYTLLLGFVFLVLDKVSERKELALSGSLMALPGFTLSNAALLTSLLTHGIGLSILVLALLPASPKKQARGAESRAPVPARERRAIA